uniref:Plastid-encoded RNA polymerase subunit alpha n=1 Tax=Caulerpa cliftonii TaxID=1004391 RepID=A0A1C9JBK8_9CHLO|nr:RNA polymerase a-subunit [Caulerpa cliftonii]AOP19240.1 RNA polymerase a-subunit [Caulerpa cliftonii]
MNFNNFYCICSKIEQNGQYYGCFKIGPFYTHTGITFANCLRRTLLADQSRFVFNAIQISGVEHEYSSLVGVRESVLDILFNLEKLTFQKNKSGQPDPKPQIALINFHGPGILQAQHIHLPKCLQCVYPDQYIATLEVDGHLNLKLFFWKHFTSPEKPSQPTRGTFTKSTKAGPPKGREPTAALPFADSGWPDPDSPNGPLNHHHKFNPRKGSTNENYLFLNSNFCSIERVNYTIQSNGFIIFEVWTNGSIHPQNAISQGINQILLAFFPYSLQIQNRNKYFFQLLHPEGNLLGSRRYHREPNESTEPTVKKIPIQKRLSAGAHLPPFGGDPRFLEMANFDFDFKTHIFLNQNPI